MAEGTVKWFSEEKKYGFIRIKGKRQDVFVHLKDVHQSGYDTLYEGDFVEFTLTEDEDGKARATDITAYEGG